MQSSPFAMKVRLSVKCRIGNRIVSVSKEKTQNYRGYGTHQSATSEGKGGRGVRVPESHPPFAS